MRYFLALFWGVYLLAWWIDLQTQLIFDLDISSWLPE